MENRNEKRNFSTNTQKEIIDLLAGLNYFCFHGSGADENCCGCCFENERPCPLATFHDKLAEKLY